MKWATIKPIKEILEEMEDRFKAADCVCCPLSEHCERLMSE